MSTIIQGTKDWVGLRARHWRMKEAVDFRCCCCYCDIDGVGGLRSSPQPVVDADNTARAT